MVESSFVTETCNMYLSIRDCHVKIDNSMYNTYMFML